MLLQVPNPLSSCFILFYFISFINIIIFILFFQLKDENTTGEHIPDSKVRLKCRGAFYRTLHEARMWLLVSFMWGAPQEASLSLA